jgi:hypothetical protein
MKIWIFAASFLALVDSAYAEQTYNLSVNQQGAIAIMNSLSNLPYKDVYNLIQDLGAQINAQTPKPDAPKVDPQK